MVEEIGILAESLEILDLWRRGPGHKVGDVDVLKKPTRRDDFHTSGPSFSGVGIESNLWRIAQELIRERRSFASALPHRIRGGIAAVRDPECKEKKNGDG